VVSVTTQREVAVVVNPLAGRGRAGRLLGPVVERLSGLGVSSRVVSGRDAAEAVGLAHKAVADGCDALVALGGDGTAHLALQAVAGTETPLALVPAGTGNDLAVALGVPQETTAAVDLVARGTVRCVDAALAGDTWWVGVLGSGFDSRVTERANQMRWPRGPRRYDVAILAELRVLRPVRFTLTLDGVARDLDAVFIAVGNSQAYGGGIRITPDAVLDDGLLDVTVVGRLSRRRLVRVLPSAYKGEHVRDPAVTQHRASTVGLASPGQVAYADGERLGPLPVRSECRAGALRVLVPAAGRQRP